MRDKESSSSSSATSPVDAISRDDLVALLDRGKFELVAEIQKTRRQPLALENEFAAFAFDGPRRALIYPELRSAFQGGRVPSAGVIRKFLTLAEFLGHVSDIRLGLKAATIRLQRDLDAVDAAGSHASKSTLQLAYLLHDVQTLQRIARQPGHPDAAAIEGRLGRYRQRLERLSIDPDEPARNLASLRDNIAVTLDRPSVVYRISPNIWAGIDKEIGSAKFKREKYLGVAEIVKASGREIVAIPQLGNAGPAFAAPFNMQDPNFVCSLGFHKYANTLSPKFLNYRTYLERWIIDFGGYSGWIRMPRVEEIEATSDGDAIGHCAEAREVMFGSLPRPPEMTADVPHLFIPLQMPNDSVESWSFMPPAEMIDICMGKFVPMGWKIVIKRHPLDKNTATAALLAELAQHDAVIIGTSPSRELVKHAAAVALVNSSVGWEAVLAQKPILSFGASEYAEVTTQVRAESDLDHFFPTLSLRDKISRDTLYHYFFTRRTVAGWDAVEGDVLAKLAMAEAGRFG